MSTTGSTLEDLRAPTPASLAPGTGPGTGIAISEVSELTGLSKDTLRWYEKEGLLVTVRRTTGGQRRYPRSAVQFVRLVQVLRRTGMLVAGVRAFVEAGPAAGPGSAESHRLRMGLLREQEASIVRQAEQLREDLAAVQTKIDSCADPIARGADCEDATFD